MRQPEKLKPLNPCITIHFDAESFVFAFALFLVFFVCRVRNFGIGNWYFWFWKLLNILYSRCEFSFFQDVQVRSEIKVDNSSSIRPMTTKFDTHKLLEELAQIRLIRLVLATPSRQDHVNLKKCYNLSFNKGNGHNICTK